MHNLNRRGGGLVWKFEFQMYMSFSTFLAFRNPVLSFLTFLNSRVLLSYKPLSYKKKRVVVFEIHPKVDNFIPIQIQCEPDLVHFQTF